MPELYWTGPGVVGIGDKEYGVEDALPVKKIDKDVLKRWKENGKVSEKFSVVVPDKRDSTISKLEDKVKGLSEEAVVNSAEAAATIAELGEAVEDRDATIAELEDGSKNLIAKIIELPDDGKKLKKAVDALKENVGGK